MDDVVRGILKGVLAMSLADGELQTEERELLGHLTERFGLEEGELADAVGDAKSFAPEKLRSELDEGEAKIVAQYAVMAAFADGTISDEEEAFLATVMERLGLKEAELRSLESMSRELAAVAKQWPVDVERLNEIVENYA